MTEIKTTHVGSLPRPREMLTKVLRKQEITADDLQQYVTAVIGKQLELGISYINNGEMGEGGSWLVEGIGEDFIPSIADFSQVTKAYSISDAESFAAARELLKKEGVLAGSSAGTLLAAALKYCREPTEAKNVVTFACDTGNKYLSKLFNDFWMEDEGFIVRPSTLEIFSPYPG